MPDIEWNLKRYLETEKLLHAFFSALDFCSTQCIKPEMEKNGHQPIAACCTQKYYALYDLAHPAFERLRTERERLFGKPEEHIWHDPVSACEYHNPLCGCVLPSHKSPVCLAYFCPQGIDLLRNEYGIFTYDYLGVNYALEWILTGDLPEKDFFEFQESIRSMTHRVKKDCA